MVQITLFLQASAYGLPVVATKNGGPVDILKVKTVRVTLNLNALG